MLLQLRLVNKRIQTCHYLVSNLSFLRLHFIKFKFVAVFDFFFCNSNLFFQNRFGIFFLYFFLSRLQLFLKHFFELILKYVCCLFVKISQSYVLHYWLRIFNAKVLNRFKKCFSTERFGESEDAA